MKKFHYLDLSEYDRQTLPRNGVQWADLTADDDYYDVFDDYAQHADDIADLERVDGTDHDFTYTDTVTGAKHYVEVREV